MVQALALISIEVHPDHGKREMAGPGGAVDSDDGTNGLLAVSVIAR
jgi:hypothetical protein